MGWFDTTLAKMPQRQSTGSLASIWGPFNTNDPGAQAVMKQNQDMEAKGFYPDPVPFAEPGRGGWYKPTTWQHIDGPTSGQNQGPISSPQPVPDGAPRLRQPTPWEPKPIYDPTQPQIPQENIYKLFPGLNPANGPVYYPQCSGSLDGLTGGSGIQIGDWNQSANAPGPNMSAGNMVTLRSPDGSETQQVPSSQLQHWLGKGAQQVA